MIRKISIVFLWILSCVLFSNQAIAEIGHYKILEEELQQKLQSLSLSGPKAREKALAKILEEKALLLFAEENNIEVSDTEVEQFFISQLGSDPRFQTNESFDYQKFNDVKFTSKIQRILSLMKSELLLSKSQTIVQAQFDISDKELLNEYIKRNARIDIGYAIIKKELADVPAHCTPQKAMDFYQDHRHEFVSGFERKIRFFVVQNSDIADSIVVTHKDLAKAFLSLDGNRPFTELQDSLAIVVKEQLIKDKALAITKKNIADWGVSQILDIPTFESPYLTRSDRFGDLAQSKIIIDTIFNLEQNEISEPIDLGFGYFVCRLQDVQNPQIGINEDNGELVWKEYVDFEKNYTFKGEYQTFFETNIDSFITSAAIVSRLVIPREISENQDIKNQILKHVNSEKKLKKIANKNNIEFSRERIYLSKFSNSDVYNTMISKNIRTFPNKQFNVIRTKDNVIAYNIHSVFPNYLPAYEDIKSEMYKIIRESKTATALDEQDLRKFYNDKKNLFKLKNSIKLSGVFVPFMPDSIFVPESEVYNYYEKNRDDYIRPEQYQFSYIYLKDHDRSQSSVLKNTSFWINETNWKMLTLAYGTKGLFPQNEWIDTKDIPQKFLKFLNSESDFSKPIYYEDGWYILKKGDYHTSGVLSYENIQEEIDKKLRNELAKALSYQTAKTLFDSTRYISTRKSFADSSMIFDLEMQDFTQEFPLLGDLKEYESDLMRLYKFGKFDRVLNLKDGCAILFAADLQREKQLSFEEAKPLIPQSYRASQKDEYISSFVDSLGVRIEEGYDPGDLFRFFGGWNEYTNVTLDSKLPGISFSQIIIEDALSKKTGEVSHPISLDEENFLIYRLDRKQKVKMTQFYKGKRLFREKLITGLYTSWLEKIKMQYKTKIYR